jgi:hypothetical protein
MLYLAMARTALAKLPRLSFRIPGASVGTPLITYGLRELSALTAIFTHNRPGVRMREGQ